MTDAQVEQDPLLDGDKTQHAADAQILIQEIGQARMEMSRLKVAYYAAREGIEITYTVKGATGSREQKMREIQKHIARVHGIIDGLQKMYIGLSTGYPIPEPEPQLKVVTKR